MGINISKYFKTHRDDYGFLYAIETIGDERELIKEIRKQNEEIEQFNSTLDEIKEICHNCWNCCDCKNVNITKIAKVIFQV